MCIGSRGQGAEEAIYLEPLPEECCPALVSDSSLPHAVLHLHSPPIPSSHCEVGPLAAVVPSSPNHYDCSPQPPGLHPSPGRDNLSPPGASCKVRDGKYCDALLKVQIPPHFTGEGLAQRGQVTYPRITQELAGAHHYRFLLCFLLCSTTPALHESSRGSQGTFQQAFTLVPCPQPQGDQRHGAGCSLSATLAALPEYRACPAWHFEAAASSHSDFDFPPCPTASGKIALPVDTQH